MESKANEAKVDPSGQGHALNSHFATEPHYLGGVSPSRIRESFSMARVKWANSTKSTTIYFSRDDPLSQGRTSVHSRPLGCGMHGLLCGPPLFWPKNQYKFDAPYCASPPKLLMSGSLKLPNSRVQFSPSSLPL
jgi:hypothetical protein